MKKKKKKKKNISEAISKGALSLEPKDGPLWLRGEFLKKLQWERMFRNATLVPLVEIISKESGLRVIKGEIKY